MARVTRTATSDLAEAGPKAPARKRPAAAKTQKVDGLIAEAEAAAVSATGEDVTPGIDAADASAGPTLKKKELVERVAEVAGVKKKIAKSVVEATLVELGAALSRGEELNLPPFGKVRVNRQRDAGGGEVLILRLRRAGRGGDEALAEAED